jgi:uncharacterized membrane protein
MEKYFPSLFRVVAFLKGIDAALETLGGVIILCVPAAYIAEFIVAITQYQLILNPNNLFAKLAQKTIDVTTESHLWAGLFLLTHGSVKLLIVVGMVLNKLWAYRVGLVVFVGLVIYQTCDFFKTHSSGLLVLTVFDCVFILLAWRQYRQL